MSVVLRGGVEIEDPLSVALEFLRGSSDYDAPDPSPWSFDEADLRRANRGGARISSVQIAEILKRRKRIERALRHIAPEASLAERSVPWSSLTQLFDPFGGIHGVGLSKTTKALHPKRPGLVPMLDSVVVEYLGPVEPTATFAERATALVRTYKRDLDTNITALRALRRELARRDRPLTEVRILDVLIWSAYSDSR